MDWLLLLAVLLAGLALGLLARSRVTRHEAGLPAGRVTYVDTGAWDRCEHSLFSHRSLLTGRPDYVVHARSGLVPVEVKSGPAPVQPYAGHVLQLAAYCLLLEETEERPPPYGILKYDNQAFEVDYTPALRARLLSILADMRKDLRDGEADRSHGDIARCRGCGFRDRCVQRLA